MQPPAPSAGSCSFLLGLISVELAGLAAFAGLGG